MSLASLVFAKLQRRRRRLRRHRSRMLHPQRLPIAPTRRIIVNRIPIIRIHPILERRRKLPKAITRDTRLAHHRALPQRHILLPQRRARRRVLLQDDRFPGSFANGVVLRDPGAAPGVVVAPLVRVEVEGAVVDGGNGEVFDEIHAFVAAVGVATVAACEGRLQPAFVAHANHVVCVQALDVLTDRSRPIRDD